jgi:F420-dependent oxidoreductase-like protein
MLGYWGAGNGRSDLELALLADRLGYGVVWTAEAYGSDAVSVLGWLSGRTTNVDLGSAIMQIPGRTPALTAMTAATLDTLADGRFRLGLGVSGPQVSEGWHGVPFASPLGRTREYVDIVRKALARERLSYDGKHFVLPLPDGPGKALTLTIPAPRDGVPIYLAAVGERSLRLTGEIADGWLAAFLTADHTADALATLDLQRRPDRPFDVVAQLPTVVGDDVEACADRVRPHAALYIGGMGSRTENFYQGLAARMGFEREARVVQEAYLAGDRKAAEAAVPFEFIDQTSLLGPVPRLADRIAEYAAAGVTTLTVGLAAMPPEERLQGVAAAAEAFERATGSA